jgi:hypothetical protein
MSLLRNILYKELCGLPENITLFYRKELLEICLLKLMMPITSSDLNLLRVCGICTRSLGTKHTNNGDGRSSR